MNLIVVLSWGAMLMKTLSIITYSMFSNIAIFSEHFIWISRVEKNHGNIMKVIFVLSWGTRLMKLLSAMPPLVRYNPFLRLSTMPLIACDSEACIRRFACRELLSWPRDWLDDINTGLVLPHLVRNVDEAFILSSFFSYGNLEPSL